jgi:hypothetical protein
MADDYGPSPITTFLEVRKAHRRLFEDLFEGFSKIECPDSMYAIMLAELRDRVDNEIKCVRREIEIDETRKAMTIDDARQASLPFVPDED